MSAQKIRIAVFAALTATAMAATGAQAQAASKSQDQASDSVVVEARPQTATLYVQNDNWQDMRIYAIVAGARHRLGTVTSFNEVRFEIPRSFVEGTSDFRLGAVPIAGRGFVTRELAVRRGDVIEWWIGNQIALSNVSVFTDVYESQ